MSVKQPPTSPPPPGTGQHKHATLGLALAFLLVCVVVISLFVNHEHHLLRDRLQAHADLVRQLASETLATDRNFLQLLADRAVADELSDADFQKRASQYVTYHPYLINITWADREFIIRHTAPLEANREVLGLKLSLPEPERASRLARATGKATYTRPFVVLQGVHAFEVYLPIFRGEEFLGTFACVYSVSSFRDTLYASLQKQGLDLQLHEQAPPSPGRDTQGDFFSRMYESLPVTEVPGLELSLSGTPGRRSQAMTVLMLLAALLGGGLCLTAIRLNHELKQRQKAERELSRSELLYRSVFDHAGIGIILAAPDRTILQANRAFARMLGYQPKELHGQDFAVLSAPGGEIVDLPVFEKAARSGADRVVVEKGYRCKDGHTLWANLTATCLRRDDGTPELLLGLVTDLSDRVAAEQAVAESERQYRTLFENMAQGVFYQEADGRITVANASACEMFGLSEDELLGRTSLDPNWKVIHEDGSDFPPAEHPSMVALTTGKKVRKVIAGVYNPRVEEVRWLLINAMPEFRPGEEKPYRVFVTLHDITELKQTEERLKESEASYRLITQQFQTLLNTISDPMYMLERDGTVHWANQRTRRMIGTEDQFGHARFKGYLGQLSIDDMTLAKQCFGSGRPQEHRTHLDNGRIVTMRAFPITDDAGQTVRVLMHIYDETDKLRLQETLMRTGQLAAVGELAAGVAHEINNPINGVINYAEILCRKMPKGSEAGRIAERIRHEGDRIAAIASSLLTYTRQGASEKRPVSLKEIVTETLLLFGTKMRNEGISIHQEISDDLPDLLVSPQQIQQVFLNLLSNSRYALNLGRHDKRLKISAHESGNGSIEVEIWDNGIGIPEAILPRIKSPFFTTKPGPEGTGLGLSICHSILSSHNSSLKIESREGEFTKVSFALPVISPASPGGTGSAEEGR